jgi:hypothetical protein
MDVERIRRRLEILRKAMSEEDIDRLYGEDQPTLEMIKNVASSELPQNIDMIIQDALSDVDVEFGSLDAPEKEIVRVLIHTARITGTKIRLNILMTEVEELVARVGPAVATATTLEPSVIRGCPDCGKELEDDPNTCSNCGWESDSPITS